MALISLDDMRTMFSEVVHGFVLDTRALLVDRQGLARALSCSLSKVDQLRELPGFPSVSLGVGSPRFDLTDVLKFLKSGAAAHLGGN